MEVFMGKRILAVLLGGLMLHVMCVDTAFGVTKAEKVKVGVSKLGVGQDTRVEVRLRDKTSVSGYISRIEAESFVVANTRTGETSTVAYTEVTRLKGHNLSTGAKIGIGIAIGFAVTALIIWLAVND
jgi:hypothetical protein